MRDAQKTSFLPGRRELVWLAGIVLLGVALRLAFGSRMAVEHFDEGVYASNYWFSMEDDGRFPLRHLYAPPLLPAAIEWSILLLGRWHLTVMLPSLAAGCLTVAVVALIARAWFGFEAALASATVAAASEIHILYSRAALTDALLCCWFLLAVYLIWLAFRTRHVVAVTGSAAVVALAMATKYNGWLPLIVALAGLVPWLLTHRRGKRPWATLTCWLVIAVGATVLWSPVWYGLQPFGGYASVAANHRGYFLGFSHWFESLARHVANHRLLEGWLSCTAVALVWPLVNVALPDKQMRRSWLAPATIGLATLAAAVALGSSVVLAALAVTGMALYFMRAPALRARDESPDYTALAVWMLAAWFFGLLLATPLYTPYPRLTLPWLISAWLGCGLAVGQLCRRFQRRAGELARNRGSDKRWINDSRPLLLVLLAAGGVLFWFAPRLVGRGVPPWQPRDGLATAAADLRDDMLRIAISGDKPVEEQVVFVYAEPGLFFHLRWQGTDFALPVSNIELPDDRNDALPQMFFFTVRHSKMRSPEFQREWSRYDGRLTLVGSYPYRPSDLVRMSERHAGQSGSREDRPTDSIDLYRLD